MPFLQPTLPDGSPNPSTLFLDALLTSALYHADDRPFRQYAALSGSVLAGFRANKFTFEPDYGILVRPGEAVVVMDGTTNATQWVSHCLSAFFPLADTQTLNTVVGSFFIGLRLVENELLDLLRPATGGDIQLVGHSYGGAAAKIFADHLQTSGNPPVKLSLLTFGEPKCTGKAGGWEENYKHIRICARLNSATNHADTDGTDPVCFTPPGVLQCIKWPLLIVLPLSALGVKWHYFGQAYGLSDNTLSPLTAFDNPLVAFDPTGWVPIADNLLNAGLHLMDSSYLPKSLKAWQRSGLNPELSAFLPYANAYMGSPFQPADNVGPPTSAQQINDAFSLPVQTITEANRSDWTTIAASATVPNSEGSIPMPAPVIEPSFKGTLFYNQEDGGSSQSFYAVTGQSNAPSTFIQMENKMKALAQFRSTLSQCEDAGPACGNPLKFVALRIDDVRTLRKGLLRTRPQIALSSYLTGTNQFSSVGYSNDQPDACYKATFQDDFGNSAIMYFHGVPIGSQTNPPNAVSTLKDFEARLAERQPSWDSRLNNFCNQLRALGLGFRYATVQWTEDGLPVGPVGNQVAASGNGTPIAIEYERAGTPPKTYTMQISTPAAPIMGKFRVICRGFKGLRVLNGRHAARGFVAGGAYYVNIKFPAPNYLPWDGYGFISPEIFSVMIPNPAPPQGTDGLPGVSGIEYTSRKVGRPFGLARGRRAAIAR